MRLLEPEQRKRLLQLARDTLREYLAHGRLPGVPGAPPALLQRRATFVTLRRAVDGELRGCRGEPMACRPLAESVMQMAIMSATDDPRFPPVTAEEIADLRIEINALTPLRPIRPEEVEVGCHGLMIVKGTSSGLLLPQVPVRYGWGRDAYLVWLCRKAGLADEAWRDEDSQIYGFETECWGEE